MKTYIQGLNIVGYTDGMFGLGEAVRLNINAAKKLDIPLNLINYEKVKQNFNYQYSFNYAINLVQLSLKDLESFIAIIDPNIFKNKYSILFLVWESEYIAPELVENLNLFNEIWTPSKYCKKIFQKTYNSPIIIVPHPVEVHLNPLPNQNTSHFFDDNKFSFLFIFSYHSSMERKNPFFLIEAFKTAFDDNDPVELVIKTAGGKHHKKQKQRLEQCNSKNIKIYDRELDKNSVNHLINSCDAYVSMHHSEGFGLTLAEAMYLGKPAVATNYSGNTEFMNDNNSFLIDYKLSYIENSDSNFCSKTLWANPLLYMAVEKLKSVYNNADLRTAKALNAKLFVKEKLSFYTIGTIIKNRLNYIYDNFDDLVTNQNQNAFLINQLQSAKIENAQLRREIRRMKKNLIIRFILILKNSIRKLKSKH
ncbi:glycosyltransferase family 4 protein [Mariniflexile litorale]|uniref:Glycosyltransferase family 4 protein n=1 Tax=Mariniflexile litorale TaxID=3045158 RepID=A0AAU7EI00_9FLAO|nr:glycosyltransferase family 4 protein [Mariniflexile sp. KMM 9835]MDQ8212013.1 glycosyltransferase family 4 protein [Mariniflexile sp. KMM 9835]